jgi:hypothetical protein
MYAPAPDSSVHRARLAREVLIALAVKAALLAGLYVAFFAPAQRSPAGAAATATAVLGTPVAPVPR